MTVYGGFWRRTAAFIIDQGILALISLFLFILGVLALMAGTGSSVIVGELFTGQSTELIEQFYTLFYLTTFLSTIIYFVFFWGYTGQTPGKMILGLHVIQVSGEKMGYRLAFFRWVGYVLSSLALYLGFLWVLWDRRKQGWHDKLAGSLVVYTPRVYIQPVVPAHGQVNEEKKEPETAGTAPDYSPAARPSLGESP